MQLFREGELSREFKSRKAHIEQEIDKLSDDDIMSGQDDIILNNVYEKYKINPIVLEDEVVENQELQHTKIKKLNPFPRDYSPNYFLVDGVKLTSTFPFSGDRLIFISKASTYSISPMPDANISSGYITISAEEALDVANENLLLKKINNDINSIRKLVGYGNHDAEIFNADIKTFIKALIDKRKNNVSKFYNISKMLDIPITRSNPKVIEEIKITRTITPLIKKDKTVTEYSISNEIYNDILVMIKHHGSSFEGTSKSIKSLKEEDLRDLILSSLNSVFEGQAHGECFRKNGKTDIIIEFENRAAFVAECKFWGGSKILISALNQLLGYTTWRDDKLCLIMFSKNKDFFKVIEEAKLSLSSVKNNISLKELDKNEFEYKIRSEKNNGQIVTIRVFLFDLSAN